MPLFEARDLLQFPNGSNATDVLINGVHFNRTVLNHWNYTLYSNGTLSNGSNCWLTFDEYKPSMLLNGTFLNATSCYSPIEAIRGHGIMGLIIGAFSGISIIFTLRNLRKHGRLYLADQKRWSVVGRRWQWYWVLFISACLTVSAINGVDVDRDYLQSTPIILQSFFYYLMLPGILACVWESVRHWLVFLGRRVCIANIIRGSWQERQICDVDPFSLPQNDIRSRTEFYLPLGFYMFDGLLFFMTVPRSWTAIEKQRSPSQTLTIARPSALDARFKAGAFFALAAWSLICYSLHHSIKHYLRRTKSLIEAAVDINNSLAKPFLGISISAVTVGYLIAGSWVWSISPLNAQVSNGWLFGLGYAPALLIIIIHNVFGEITTNDDKALSIQRQHRGRNIDRELGLDRVVQKPSWWSKMSGDHHTDITAEERLRQLTSEIGGGPATTKKVKEAFEMKLLRNELNAKERRKTDHEGKAEETKPEYFVRGSTMLEAESSFVSPKVSNTYETSTPLPQAKTQVIRSMLDV